jgi:hypothetical protein
LGSSCWAGISWPAAGFALLSLVAGLMAAPVEDLILIPSGIDFLNSPWVSSAAMLGTAGSFTLYIRGVQEVAVGEAVHVNTSIVMAKVMIVFQAFHFSGRVCS